MSDRAFEPIGVILAGGLGRRIGGQKATVRLRGRPLISYPFEALQGALAEVAIIAKSTTQLPSLPGANVWIESERRSHPLVGITQALALAEGRPVLVCAADFPFVTASFVRGMAQTDPGSAPALIAASGGAIQPLLGCYQPAAEPLLAAAARELEVPLREAVAAIGPRLLELTDPQLLFNVNAPEDLLYAERMLEGAGAGQPNVKS